MRMMRRMMHRRRDGMAPRSAWVWARARALGQGRAVEVEACDAVSASRAVARTVKALVRSAPMRAGVCVLTCDGCCGGARDRVEERESVTVRRRRRGW